MDKQSQYAAIMRELSAVRFVSGNAIAKSLGLSRTLVNRRVREMQGMGTPINAIAGKGYHLDEGAGLLAFPSGSPLPDVHYAHHTLTCSTSDDVLQMARVVRQPYLVTSDYQVQGRGRRGNGWSGAFGLDVAVSYGTALGGPEGLSPYSVMVGVVLARWLRDAYRLSDIRVKWPNDLWLEDRKLAGVLVELHTLQGELYMVTGVGMNVNSRHQGRFVSLRDALGGVVDRALVVEGLSECLRQVHAGECSDWFEAWQEFDALKDRRITLQQGKDTLVGIARGIDRTGNLLLERDNGIVAVNGGVAHVRPV